MRYRIALYVILVAILAPYFYSYSKVMSISGAQWASVGAAVQEDVEVGQDIVFCPSYLKFFANQDEDLFDNFRKKTKPQARDSYYQEYFTLGFCGDDESRQIQANEYVDMFLTRHVYEEKIRENMAQVFPALKVFTSEGGSAKECVFSDGRYNCGAEWWRKVFLRYAFADGHKMLCAFVSPASGSSVNMIFPKLKEGVLHLGFLDYAANDPGNLGDITVKIGGRSYYVNRERRLVHVPVSAEEEVKLEVSAVRFEGKHLCVGYEGR